MDLPKADYKSCPDYKGFCAKRNDHDFSPPVLVLIRDHLLQRKQKLKLVYALVLN